MSDKAYRWVVEIEIDPLWVGDGFDLDEQRVLDMLLADLNYARTHEVSASIVSAPDPRQIRAEQGYKEPGYEPWGEDA